MQQMFYAIGFDAFVFTAPAMFLERLLLRIGIQLFDFFVPERDGPGEL